MQEILDFTWITTQFRQLPMGVNTQKETKAHKMKTD